jgi:nuclear cap-binding protein subunit 1
MLTGTWANQTILGSQFLLPEGPVKPIYYMALITELGKLSLQTVGPALESAPHRPHSRTGT